MAGVDTDPQSEKGIRITGSYGSWWFQPMDLFVFLFYIMLSFSLSRATNGFYGILNSARGRGQFRYGSLYLWGCKK